MISGHMIQFCSLLCSITHELVILCLSDVQCCLFILSSSALEICWRCGVSLLIVSLAQLYLAEMVMGVEYAGTVLQNINKTDC